MSFHLEFTDKGFVFAGKSYPSVPLLVSSDYLFVAPVCSYLRYLITHEQLAITSAVTYAEYIRHFWNFLEKENLKYDEIGDSDLLRWFNRQDVKNVGRLTQSARCDVIFDMYIWFEQNQFTHQIVRVPGYNDRDEFIPRLTARPVRHNAAVRRISKFGIVSAVRPRASASKRQPTPTVADITELYIAANVSDSSINERNNLLIDWYLQAGLRRLEWVALKVDSIPSWKIIDELLARNEAYELELTITKGSKSRRVSILPELLGKTREYIETSRSSVVDRFSKKSEGTYSEPKEIFLSNKTGKAMNLTAVSNLLTSWFKAAGVDGHGHRLRAVFLTNLFEAELSAEESRISLNPGTKLAIDYELILLKVAERAGHMNIESLRPYLALVRKRRGRIPGKVDAVTLQQQVTARQQELAVLEQKIALRKAELGTMAVENENSNPVQCGVNRTE